MLFHPSSRLHIGWRRESERRREEKYGWLRVDQAATVVYKRLIFLCTKIDSSSMSYCERDFASSSLSELSSCWRWHVLDFHSSSPPLAAIIDERLETETTAIKTREMKPKQQIYRRSFYPHDHINLCNRSRGRLDSWRIQFSIAQSALPSILFFANVT